MSSSPRFFHIHTGRSPLTRAADAWLAAAGAESRTSHHLFDACAQMARADTPEPDVVLLDIGELAPGDLTIIDFARRAWPRAAILAYGAPGAAVGESLARNGVACCGSPAQLLAALQGVAASPPAPAPVGKHEAIGPEATSASDASSMLSRDEIRALFSAPPG